MLRLTAKQNRVIELIKSRDYDIIVLFGTVGTGKSHIAAHAMISMAWQYPNTYIPVWRLNSTTATRTIVPTYLDVMNEMNLTEGKDFKHVSRPDKISIKKNGSLIEFIEADHTKDRQGRKIKGINATSQHLDEVDELEQIMATQIMSRKGRKNKHGQPSVNILTMNPNERWARKYYKMYRDGNLPDNIAAVEFSVEDMWLEESEVNVLKQNDRQWTERYLYNNWDYGDDDASLFKYRILDNAEVDKYDIKDDARAALDVARSGTDRSVASLWVGNVLVDIKVIKESDESISTTAQAKSFIKYCEQHSVGYENARVDAVGVGAGVVDAMHELGFNVQEFNAGSSSDGDYNNARSEHLHQLALDFEKGDAFIYSGCPYKTELKKELTQHNYGYKRKTFFIESKDDIKKRLGKSPDIADSVYMSHFKKATATVRARFISFE